MSSIEPKDYFLMLNDLSTALNSVNEAKGTSDVELKKEKLKEAFGILEEVGEQLKTAGESVKGQGKILDVMAKYNHVLRKFDEVNSYSASGEKIVRGAGISQLKKTGESIKLFFNEKLALLYGRKSYEGEAITAGMALSEKADAKLEAFKKKYNELQDALMKGGKVNAEALNSIRSELGQLKDEFKTFGVPNLKLIGSQPSAEPLKREQLEDDASTSSSSSSESVASETPIVQHQHPGNSFGWLASDKAGVGALRRKLVLEFAKLDSLDSRLTSLKTAAEVAIKEPEFKIVTEKNKITGAKTDRIEGIENKSIPDIEATFIALRDLDKTGLPPERLTRIERALSLYRKEFDVRADALLGITTGKFKKGEIFSRDVQGYTDAAAAAFFTFNPGDPIAALRFGRLVAHLMLENKPLEIIRERLTISKGKIPNETVFSQGYLSILNERLKATKDGSYEREELIGKIVDAYPQSDLNEKEAIGNFLDKISPLPESASPEVFLKRQESALNAPDGGFKETPLLAMEKTFEYLKLSKPIKEMDMKTKSELKKVISGGITAALNEGDSAKLLEIEADLERLRVNSNLVSIRGVIVGQLQELQGSIKGTQTLSFNRMKSLIEMPLKNPSGNTKWSAEDLRALLSVVRKGAAGERLPSEAREQIARALNKGEILGNDSIGVKELIKLINDAKKSSPPRDIVVAQGYALLKQVSTRGVGGRLYSSYRGDLVSGWRRPPIGDEGFIPDEEQAKAIEGWLPKGPISALTADAGGATPVEGLKSYAVLIMPLREAAVQNRDDMARISLEFCQKEVAQIENLKRIVEQFGNMQSTPVQAAREAVQKNIELHEKFLKKMLQGEASLDSIKSNVTTLLRSPEFEALTVSDLQIWKDLRGLDVLAKERMKGVPFFAVDTNYFSEGKEQSLDTVLNLPFQHVSGLEGILRSLYLDQWNKQNPEEAKGIKDLLPSERSKAQSDEIDRAIKSEVLPADETLSSILQGYKVLRNKMKIANESMPR